MEFTRLTVPSSPLISVNHNLHIDRSQPTTYHNPAPCVESSKSTEFNLDQIECLVVLQDISTNGVGLTKVAHTEAMIDETGKAKIRT